MERLCTHTGIPWQSLLSHSTWWVSNKVLVQDPVLQKEEVAATMSAKSGTRSTKPNHSSEGGGGSFTITFTNTCPMSPSIVNACGHDHLRLLVTGNLEGLVLLDGIHLGILSLMISNRYVWVSMIILGPSILSHRSIYRAICLTCGGSPNSLHQCPDWGGIAGTDLQWIYLKSWYIHSCWERFVIQILSNWEIFPNTSMGWLYSNQTSYLSV